MSSGALERNIVEDGDADNFKTSLLSTPEPERYSERSAAHSNAESSSSRMPTTPHSHCAEDDVGTHPLKEHEKSAAESPRRGGGRRSQNAHLLEEEKEREKTGDALTAASDSPSPSPPQTQTQISHSADSGSGQQHAAASPRAPTGRGGGSTSTTRLGLPRIVGRARAPAFRFVPECEVRKFYDELAGEKGDGKDKEKGKGKGLEAIPEEEASDGSDSLWEEGEDGSERAGMGEGGGPLELQDMLRRMDLEDAAQTREMVVDAEMDGWVSIERSPGCGDEDGAFVVLWPGSGAVLARHQEKVEYVIQDSGGLGAEMACRQKEGGIGV